MASLDVLITRTLDAHVLIEYRRFHHIDIDIDIDVERQYTTVLLQDLLQRLSLF